MPFYSDDRLDALIDVLKADAYPIAADRLVGHVAYLQFYDIPAPLFLRIDMLLKSSDCTGTTERLLDTWYGRIVDQPFMDMSLVQVLVERIHESDLTDERKQDLMIRLCSREDLNPQSIDWLWQRVPDKRKHLLYSLVDQRRLTLAHLRETFPDDPLTIEAQNAKFWQLDELLGSTFDRKTRKCLRTFYLESIERFSLLPDTGKRDVSLYHWELRQTWDKFFRVHRFEDFMCSRPCLARMEANGIGPYYQQGTSWTTNQFLRYAQDLERIVSQARLEGKEKRDEFLHWLDMFDEKANPVWPSESVVMANFDALFERCQAHPTLAEAFIQWIHSGEQNDRDFLSYLALKEDCPISLLETIFFSQRNPYTFVALNKNFPLRDKETFEAFAQNIHSNTLRRIVLREDSRITEKLCLDVYRTLDLNDPKSQTIFRYLLQTHRCQSTLLDDLVARKFGNLDVRPELLRNVIEYPLSMTTLVRLHAFCEEHLRSLRRMYGQREEPLGQYCRSFNQVNFEELMTWLKEETPLKKFYNHGVKNQESVEVNRDCSF